MPIRQPKLQPVVLPITYSSDNWTAERTIERDTSLCAIAVSVKEQAALNDHFATSMLHNNYQALGGDLDATSGVPLAVLACSPRFPFTSGQPAHRPAIAPWPGRANDLDFLTNSIPRVLVERGDKSKEMKELQDRLKLAKALPRTVWPTTLWPLEGGSKFTLAGRRISGGTTITEVVLWCVKLPKGMHKNQCTFMDLPFWAQKRISGMSATASTVGENSLLIESKENYGFWLRQIFARAHDAASGLFDEDYLRAITAKIKYENAEFYDAIAQTRISLHTQCPGFIQDYDVARDMDVMINPKSNLVFDLATLATVEEKVLHLTAYGLVSAADAEMRQAIHPTQLV